MKKWNTNFLLFFTQENVSFCYYIWTWNCNTRPESPRSVTTDDINRGPPDIKQEVTEAYNRYKEEIYVQIDNIQLINN